MNWSGRTCSRNELVTPSPSHRFVFIFLRALHQISPTLILINWSDIGSEWARDVELHEFLWLCSVLPLKWWVMESRTRGCVFCKRPKGWTSILQGKRNAESESSASEDAHPVIACKVIVWMEAIFTRRIRNVGLEPVEQLFTKVPSSRHLKSSQTTYSQQTMTLHPPMIGFIFSETWDLCTAARIHQRNHTRACERSRMAKTPTFVIKLEIINLLEMTVRVSLKSKAF